jgi:HPt (histidine-containing phosphotransfer) domain-containing protein
MQTERIEVRVPANLQPLMPRFLANRTADVGQLETALASGDAEAMRKIGHTLKGAGGGYGFAEISRIGAAIEQAARGGDFDALAQETALLKRYLECVHVVFE